MELALKVKPETEHATVFTGTLGWSAAIFALVVLTILVMGTEFAIDLDAPATMIRHVAIGRETSVQAADLDMAAHSARMLATLA